MLDRRTLALVALATLLAAANAPANEWDDLLPHGTLDEWTLSETNAKVWSIQEGALVGDNRTGGDTSIIISKREVTDFDAEFEMRIQEGRIALRKWHSFTLYLDAKSLEGSTEWVQVGLSIRGSDVRLYLNSVRAALGDQQYKGGTEHIWLMADPGALVSFRNVRLRHVDASEPDPFESRAPSGPPDMSEARRLFSGSSLLGWEVTGDWKVEDGAARAAIPADAQGGCWILTGRPTWGDGVLFFEVQGLGDKEELAVFLNIDESTRQMTQVRVPGSNALDQTAWHPITIGFRGEKVQFWIGGECYDLPRNSKFGKLGFGVLPGTDCAIRDIRVLLDK